MIASSSSALALASIFVLTCVTLLTTVPVVDAGMMTNMLNKAYSFLGYETCEHPNVHNYGARSKISNSYVACMWSKVWCCIK